MHHELQLDYFHIGDVFKELKKIPSKSCRCCTTSPPYWGLRDYLTAKWLGGNTNCDHSRATDILNDATASTTIKGTNGQLNNHIARKKYKDKCGKCGAICIDNQIGLEKTPEQYIKKIVLVFREIRRILTDDGVIWLNIGDSYFGGKGASGDARADKQKERLSEGKTISRVAGSIGQKGKMSPLQGRHKVLKPKDLCGIPWRVALALLADGWWLRNDCIWEKPNPMPSSVTDRCTVNHEYIFLLTKSSQYYFDQMAIRQQLAESVLNDARYYDDEYRVDRVERGYPGQQNRGGGLLKRKSGNIERKYGDAVNKPEGNGKHQGRSVPWEGETANKKTVWNIAAKGFNGEYCIACERFYSGKEKSLIRKKVEIENGKEVKKSYCLCGRHDAWISHFAVFPQKLITDCIKAGTSEYGQCADCGAPWERITEKTLKPTAKASPNTVVETHHLSADTNDQNSNRVKSGQMPGFYNEFITKGWQPTCECHGKLEKHIEREEPVPIYDDEQEVVGYEPINYKIYYSYNSEIPLNEHPVKPDIVLDPFSGAGTTALVAKKLGRNFIGIEINRHYVTMSIKRLKKELGWFYTPQMDKV